MFAVVTQNGAVFSAGINLIRTQASHLGQIVFIAGFHRAPLFAVVMEDNGVVPNRENIIVRRTPNRQQVLFCSGFHRCPLLAVKMQDSTLGPDNVNAIVARTPNTIKGDRLFGQFLPTLKSCAVIESINALASNGMNMLNIFSPKTEQIVDG